MKPNVAGSSPAAAHVDAYADAELALRRVRGSRSAPGPGLSGGFGLPALAIAQVSFPAGSGAMPGEFTSRREHPRCGPVNFGSNNGDQRGDATRSSNMIAALIIAGRIVLSIVLWDTTAGDVAPQRPTIQAGEQGSASFVIASCPDGAR